MAIGFGKFIGGISFGVSMDNRKLDRNVKKSRGIIGGFVGQTTKMLGVYAGSTGVVTVIGKAANSFEQLNRSMNRSLAIMGDVSKSMRSDMRDAAIEVARVTNASSKQAADAYFFLASAGLNAAQSLEALPKVAKFAQAGNFDMALATDLLTDSQSALGLTVKDTQENIENMTRVSDVLVKANTLANASVQQFSEALTNKAGAALRLLGKDVEEGVAVLAAFADQGVKGAEAGTGFGIVLRDLQTKAIKFSGAFDRARVRVFDASGEMRNMADIISDLERRMTGLSDQSKKNFLLGLGFSDKSVAFVQALIGVSDKVREYEKALRGAGGATEEVAGKQLTDMEKATNRLSAAFDSISGSMAPVVSSFAAMAESIASILENSEKIRKGNPPSTLASEESGFLGFRRRKPGQPINPLGGMESAINELEEIRRGIFEFSGFNDDTSFQALKEFFETKGASAVVDVGPKSTRTSPFSDLNSLSASLDSSGGFTVGRKDASLPRRAKMSTPEGVRQVIAEDQINAIRSAVSKAAPKIGFLLFDKAEEAMRRSEGGKKLATAMFDKVADGIGGTLTGIQGGFGNAILGFMGLQKRVADARAAGMRNGVEFEPNRSSLTFARSGSAESFRQRARIRNQRDSNKLDKKRNSTLDQIRDSLANNPVVLAAANLEQR